MDVRALLTDGFDRIAELYADLADGLDEQALHHRPAARATRSAGCCGTWRAARTTRWPGCPASRRSGSGGRRVSASSKGLDDIGYGHTSAQVDAVRIEDPALLVDYHREVVAATSDYLARVDEDELDRVVDERWDPPVTAGVRLVSIQGDCLQHLGQVGYVLGLR